MPIKKKILLVDDDAVSRNVLRGVLGKYNFTIDEASDGKEGLELYKQKKHHLIITDLEMPVMNGNDMILHLKDIGANPMIIILTAHGDSDTIIDSMKLGVYDYIVKTGNTDEMLIKIKRALETADLLHIKQVTEKEKMVKLHEQLQWCEWNEKVLKRDKTSFDKELFRSLHLSFNQGVGIGTMLTLLKLISETAEKKGSSYIIDGELFEIINENAAFAETAINTFSEINNIITSEMTFENATLSELHDFVKEIINKMQPIAELGEHNILLSDKKDVFKAKYVGINKKYIQEVINELLLNAMKFSKKESDIFVIIEIEEDSTACVSVLNTPVKLENGIYGIPIEYENLVFEPFFRIAKKVYPDYKTLDYGLGLTLVEKIISQHNGDIRVLNITDYSKIDKEPVEKVDMSVELPLIDVNF